MTFGDLFTNLFLLLIVSVPALIVALVHERKRRSRQSGTRPYTWGLFTGYTLTFGGGLILAVSLTYPLWADPEEYTASEILGQVLYSTLVCLVPGIFILRRERWAWVWEIVTSLALAPLRIPIDIIYLKNRWQEMKPGAEPTVAPPPLPSDIRPKKSKAVPVLLSVGLGLLVLFGGCHLLLKHIQGNAPIHTAASNGDLVRLRSLLQQDPSLLSTRNKIGNTQLHLAALDGRARAVELLVRAGAPGDQLTTDGWTPLLHASQLGELDTARVLLDLGANVNFRSTNYGNSPLHRAANFGYIDMANLLIARGAQVSIRNNSNNTPLHRAVNGDYPDMVELLIANGAEVNIRNDYGRTPLKIATEGDYRKCGRILRDHGAHE